MAEKGILVQDASTGESVACRDAVENDSDGNSRIVQLFDDSTRKNSILLSAPLRGPVTTSDSFALSPIPADIINNVLTIGDASSICVSVTYKDSGSDDYVYVTPVVIELSSDIVIGLLEPKLFSAVNEQWDDGYASPFSLADDYLPTIMQIWDVFGAYRIGFHISENGTSTLNLYACVCSGNSSAGFSAIKSTEKDGIYGLGN